MCFCKHGHDDGLWEGGPCANEETAKLFGKLCAERGIEPDSDTPEADAAYEEASERVEARKVRQDSIRFE